MTTPLLVKTVASARRRSQSGAVAGTAILLLFLGAWAAVFLFARGSGSC